MPKIFIFGPPGSGKSTLALRMARETGLPLFHVDKFFFKAPRIFVPHDEALTRLIVALPEDHWIVEGSNGVPLRYLATHATQCIVLDLSPWRCLLRIMKRQHKKDSALKATISEGWEEALTWNFIWFTLRLFPKHFKEQISEIQMCCKGVVEVRRCR